MLGLQLIHVEKAVVGVANPIDLILIFVLMLYNFINVQLLVAD